MLFPSSLFTPNHSHAQLCNSPDKRFPNNSVGIPKLLWYKLGPKGLNEDTRAWTESCIELNPTYTAEFMTDEAADAYVKNTFASRSDIDDRTVSSIVESYLGLTIPILKADFLRYLLLFDKGGIWSDLDVSCKGVPFDAFVLPQYKDAALVVGWEFDMGWDMPFVRQFASWTILAKPGSPHMWQVIVDILDSLSTTMASNNVTIGNLTLSMVGDVVDFTGPRRLTNSIYKSLGKTLKRTIGEKDMSKLLQPKLVGDVLVMPGRSFAASSNRYTKEEEAQLPAALVTHHYAGSWKNDHGGESV
ncbi:uncharacterized protein EI97DRAFT_449987 [Westerdykella ornata]|uniref:Initiation-specific alpha-1,6-mannosyltransferase n=1 Tax=Westerdykella ornata TaxID=318751 RepID=A0A6A6JJ80_WESOR|nr:uncharacterized protein EI97DRAFT_449987 [Westerdykella ornata]KAF2276651.1 hypothetical protein EI97DRAFT_449987 [Westerdykella ornata]